MIKSVKTRLIVAFGTLTILAMLVSAFSLRAISEGNKNFSSYLGNHAVVVNTVIEVREAVNARAIAARNLISVSSDKDKKVELAAVTAAHQHMTEALASLQKRVKADPHASDTDMQAIKKIAEIEALYGPVALDIVAMTTEGRISEAVKKLTEECRPLLSRLLTEVSAYLEYSDNSSKAAITSSQQSFERTRIVLIVVTVFTLLSALVSSYLFVSSLFRSLGAEPTELEEIVGRVASGDLGAVEESKNVKPTGVYAGLAMMQEQLRDAQIERERVEESKQLAAELEQRKEAEARQREEDLRKEELRKVDQERQEAIELQKRVDKLLFNVQAVAKGDLTKSMVLNGDDAVSKIADEFEVLLKVLRGSFQNFKSNAGALGNASDQLSDLNRNLNESAHSTANQSDLVSSAAGDISANINNVAVSIQQMSASIKDIAANSKEAASVAEDAVALASNTDVTVRQLSKSSNDIGAVVKAINSIAEQTNLLALNATIEAARAGESGKGFAVVANEVKELAKETAKATDEISQKIATIQNDSQDAVGAIANIREIILRINKFQTTVAVAVDEQSATTTEMSRAITKTSEGSNEIARNVLQVATNARDNLANIESVQSTAGDLSTMSAELDRLVGEFKV